MCIRFISVLTAFFVVASMTAPAMAWSQKPQTSSSATADAKAVAGAGAVAGGGEAVANPSVTNNISTPRFGMIVGGGVSASGTGCTRSRAIQVGVSIAWSDPTVLCELDMLLRMQAAAFDMGAITMPELMKRSEDIVNAAYNEVMARVDPSRTPYGSESGHNSIGN